MVYKPNKLRGSGGELKEMGRKQRLGERGRVKVFFELPEGVYADFRAAVERRGRSGRFVVEKFMGFYAKWNDAQEAEFFAQGAKSPTAVEGER